ncbi:MAG: methyltransferase domain-containing protein [Gammaproteobacteria bacterium]
MAVLWQRRVRGTQYEVRQAGHSIRLYTDGVFHSQYNPKRPLTHGVWDLLMLPALYYPPGKVRRVLVLGVGGGAVLQLLRHFVQPDEIVGIEINPVHLSIARRHFGIQPQMATLHQADALKWLHQYRGPAFDMIIDDLFTEVEGEPQRVVPLTTRWCSLLHRHTTRTGLVVVNSMSYLELRNSAFLRNQRLAQQYPTRLALNLPVYENAVGAFFKTAVSRADLTRHLAERHNTASLQKLDYRVRTLVRRLA